MATFGSGWKNDEDQGVNSGFVDSNWGGFGEPLKEGDKITIEGVEGIAVVGKPVIGEFGVHHITTIKGKHEKRTI